MFIEHYWVMGTSQDNRNLPVPGEISATLEKAGEELCAATPRERERAAKDAHRLRQGAAAGAGLGSILALFVRLAVFVRSHHDVGQAAGA
jgi:hypothetical protein